MILDLNTHEGKGDSTHLTELSYVLESKKNLISVSNLNKSDYFVYFNKNVLLKIIIYLFAQVYWLTNLFHFTLVSLLPIIENKHVSPKRKVPNTNQTFIWRLHLGHINLIHSQFMELDNLFEVVVHHFLIGMMGGLGH